MCLAFAEKRIAEQAVLRIHGVRALANELEVRFLAGSEQTDEDIALKAASALLWHSLIPKDHIKFRCRTALSRWKEPWIGSINGKLQSQRSKIFWE